MHQVLGTSTFNVERFFYLDSADPVEESPDPFVSSVAVASRWEVGPAWARTWWDLDSFRPIQRGHAYIGKVPVNGVFLAASTAATLRSHSINAKRLLVLSLTSWWKDVELHKELWTPSGSQAGVLLLTESTVPCGRVDRSSSKHAPWELRLGCPPLLGNIPFLS